MFPWAIGDKYDGDWKVDNRNGHGFLTPYNGFEYDEWKDDNRHAHGCLSHSFNVDEHPSGEPNSTAYGKMAS
jgi:hypothetical protein